MKYYKLNKIIYSYDEQQVAIGLADDKTELTAEELELHMNPPKTAEELILVAKQAKRTALETLTVTTSNGNTFDGNEAARINMVSAIAVADIAGMTEKPWKLADNTIKTITLAELKEALLLSILAVGEIVL